MYLFFRRDVLEELVKLQNFENQFLPNALRKFFQETHPPKGVNKAFSCQTQHHESHATSPFYPLPLHEAAILTMDEVGER